MTNGHSRTPLDTHTVRHCAVALVATALTLVPSQEAQAQSRTTVAPSVTFIAGYDENPIWRAGAPSGVVIGVAPAITARRESELLDLFATYRFGADRFSSYPVLSSPIASQQGQARARRRFGPLTTLDVSGGFATTLTPTVFNIDTGIALDPGRAWHGDGGVTLAREITARTGIDLTARLTAERITAGGSLRTSEVELRARHEASPRNSLDVRYRAAWHRVDDRLTEAKTIMSLGWLGGWARRLTPATTLRLVGGIRLDDGTMSPQVEGAIERTAPTGWVAGISAIRTRTPALGLSQLVDLDRVQGHARFIWSSRIETGVAGGLFRNEIGPTTVRIYTVTTDLAVPVGRTVSLVVAGGLHWQRTSGLPFDTRPATAAVPQLAGVLDRFSLDDPLRRSTISVSFVISGPALGRAMSDDPQPVRKQP